MSEIAAPDGWQDDLTQKMNVLKTKLNIKTHKEGTWQVH